MIGLTLFAGALAAAAAQPAGLADRAEALEACGLADAAVIDASAITTAADLAKHIRKAGAQPAVVAKAELDGQDMRALAPLLRGGCLLDSSLKQTDWAGVTIPDLRIVRTNMEGARFTGAALVRARLEGAGLAKADFSDASLMKSRFVGAYGLLSLSGTRFDRADLGGVVFECGITIDAWCNDSYEARFAGARLHQADLTTLGIWDEAMLSGALLGPQTALNPRSLPYLQTAKVSDNVLLRAWIKGETSGDTPPAEASLTPEELRSLVAATTEFAADKPSFDCAKARTRSEQLVCGEYASELRALDRDLDQLYREARAENTVNLESQRQWLAARDRCGDDDCVRSSYGARIDTLFAKLGNRAAIAQGRSVTYHSDVLPLPGAMRGRALYGRILPVLVEASWQSTTLTGNADGSLSAQGNALGANAHECSLGIEAARFDPATGWFAATAEDGQSIPLFRIWGDRLIMRYSGNMGDTPDEAQEFVSCGARAAFSDLRYLGG